MGIKKVLNKSVKKDHSKRNLTLGAIGGTILGVFAGLLFAPRKGKETRELLVDNAKKTLNDVTETAKKITEKTCDKIIELKKGTETEDSTELQEFNPEEDI